MNKKKEQIQTDFKRLAQLGFDFSFLERVQPIGSIEWKENVIVKSTGYEAILHVYSIPSNVPRYWLSNFGSGSNGVVKLDFKTIDRGKVIGQLTRSIREETSNISGGKNQIERNEAAIKAAELEAFATSLTMNSEITKLLHVRIAVSATTMNNLEEEIKVVKAQLEESGFNCALFVGDQKEEWLSLFYAYAVQDKFFNRIHGQLLTSHAIGHGYPFHNVELKDPRGGFFGLTTTQGAVLFDMFYRNEKRPNYNTSILGKTGSGKSTKMKKLLEDAIRRGHRVLGFNYGGEIDNLLSHYNGASVDLFGSKGKMNPMQVLPSTYNEEGSEIDEYASFQSHLTNLMILYYSMDRNFTDTSLNILNLLLNQFYVDFGIWTKDLSKANETKITSLGRMDYPILEEFLEWLIHDPSKTIHNIIGNEMRDVYQLILTTTRFLVETVGVLFNGYTEIENFGSQQFVMFDITKMANYPDGVKFAKLYSALQIMWADALVHGRSEAEKLRRGEIAIDEVRGTLILIDECHNIINSDSLFAVKQIVKFEREARKYFGSICFATQSPREMFPDNADSEATTRLKQVFELTSNRFTFALDESVMPLVREMYGSYLTETQYQAIPTLTKGECIATFGSEVSLQMKVDYDPDRDDVLYKGGV